MDSAWLFDEWVSHLRIAGLSPETRRVYGYAVEALARHLGKSGKSILDATENDLTDWRSGWPLAPSSVRTYMAAVRNFYQWAGRKYPDLIQSDPAQYVPVPKVPRRLPRPIPDQELERAIAHAPGGGRLRLWLVLAGYAGLRCIEIARLRRDALLVLPGGQRAVMVLGKGDKERLIPLSDYVWDEIGIYGPALGNPMCQWFFPRLRGDRSQHVPANVVSTMGNAHLRACGYARSMHTLRHRFGSSSYAVDHNLRVVQELLGHNDPKTSALYAAFSPQDASRTVAQIQPAPHGRRFRLIQGDA